jgi:hypothetical protein
MRKSFFTSLSICLLAPAISATSLAAEPAKSLEHQDLLSSCFRNHWYFNVDATAFSPIRDTGISEHFLDDNGTEYGPLTNNIATDRLTAAPRLTLGKTTADGWGLQSTYWDFNSTNSDGFAGLTPSPPVTGLELYASSAQTRAYTFDIEATRRLRASSFLLTGSLGARYGSIRNTDSSYAVGLSSDLDLYTASSQAQTGFHGAGLTYSISAIRPTRGPWSFYANSRLSNLFGTNYASANTSIIGAGPSGFAPAASGARSAVDDHLFIAESQAGIMWNKCLAKNTGKMFARAGFEYQYWNSADLSATSVSDSAFGTSLSDVYAEASDLKTQFIGFSVGTGFSW